MAKTRVFVSFDYDHDDDLKVMLIGQAALRDSPFEIADVSIKEASYDWKDKARQRIKGADQVAVICGEHTDSASGVSVELGIAQELKKPYFLLHGRKDKTAKKPTAARSEDKLYSWTWDNLKNLIGGSR